jgi:hypothetical protein
MWNKHDEAHGGTQPDFASSETPDLALLGDAMVKSLMNDQLKKGSLAVVPQKVLAEDPNPPMPSEGMKTYMNAVNEFTQNATAFIEHLPLLAKARAAYEEAMRASTEMRKVLDVGEENLRTLMAQLELGLNVHVVKPSPDKKNPEPAIVERMRGTDEGASRAVRWP